MTARPVEEFVAVVRCAAACISGLVEGGPERLTVWSFRTVHEYRPSSESWRLGVFAR